jgi:hypothetical protein
MMKEIVKCFLLLLSILVMNSACKKYLDEKPNKKLVVPDKLEDLESILNNYYLFNASDPSTGELSSTDFYLTDQDYNALPDEFVKRAYTWEKDYIFNQGVNGNDWASVYNTVYGPNTVLELLTKIERNPGNAKSWDRVAGQASFLRGKAFFNALQIWSQAYDANTANTNLGIPLRVQTDFNIPSVRATVQDSYAQVISDLQFAAEKLPTSAPHATVSSKPAAYAMLSRTYLMMRAYQQARLYADSALSLKNGLNDFNTLDSTVAYPVPKFSQEIIYDSNVAYNSALVQRRAKIAPELYSQYENNDLRKTMYFKLNADGSHSFRGSYSSTDGRWSGLAVDEMLLNRAECFAREGNIEMALQDLNSLLIKRWKSGTFIPYTVASARNVLNLILTERRKELLMRSLRWMDVKRLNKEGAGLSLTRLVNGKTHELPANDLRFALPIPEDVISISGMIQNPR